ncbi:putative lipid II flippase FtsW [Speluncibacter jeojiensis]|uniref:Probable peptidoglycan glycosyltransferase FtsW n=1 Tax=Speluncibacter jeojiensis TaxID=2710754 RepID=A0A9X4LY31_9ACTN|nr:putative lipid II flippase FtsW [Corynebacteriales bacterium D3-21]
MGKSGAEKTSTPRTPIGVWLAGPLASFHLIVTVSVLLTVLGLVMVLSASSVEAYAADGSAYSLFTSQLIFTVLGAALFYVALRLPIRLLRRVSFPALIISVVLLVMVLIPGIGDEVGGGRRWFTIGSLSLQPSETTKVVLAIWGAHLLASRRRENATIKEMIIPLVPVSMLIFVLVVLEPNLSTTIALGIIVVALLWFAGLPLKIFGALLGGGVTLAIIAGFTAGYRSARIRAWLNPGADSQGADYQSRQAKYSLADGGLFGRGLGQSRAKWSYLPNAHNDFIFAILGEELGFIGCAVVFGLFALFAYTGMRIAARSLDPFLKLMVSTATVWTIGQAFINIGYVVGLLPVTGLQLPLISAGGSSTAMTLFMFGVIANAARHEPAAIAALQAGREPRFWRLLRLPSPEPYSPQDPFGVRSKQARKAKAKKRPVGTQPAMGKTRGGPPGAGKYVAGKPGKPAQPRKAPTKQPQPRAGQMSAGRPTAARTPKPAKQSPPKRSQSAQRAGHTAAGASGAESWRAEAWEGPRPRRSWGEQPPPRAAGWRDGGQSGDPAGGGRPPRRRPAVFDRERRMS